MPGIVDEPVEETQCQRHAHEPLLRAVVEVAFEAPALRVAGPDDAGPRRRELLARLRVGERYDPINEQLGVVDQRLETWFDPFGWTAPTGYLHERPTGDE